MVQNRPRYPLPKFPGAYTPPIADSPATEPKVPGGRGAPAGPSHTTHPPPLHHHQFNELTRRVSQALGAGRWPWEWSSDPAVPPSLWTLRSGQHTQRSALFLVSLYFQPASIGSSVSPCSPCPGPWGHRASPTFYQGHPALLSWGKTSPTSPLFLTAQLGCPLIPMPHALSLSHSLQRPPLGRKVGSPQGRLGGDDDSGRGTGQCKRQVRAYHSWGVLGGRLRHAVALLAHPATHGFCFPALPWGSAEETPWCLACRVHQAPTVPSCFLHTPWGASAQQEQERQKTR